MSTKTPSQDDAAPAGFETLLRFQQQQWLGLMAWQQTLFTAQQDLVDQWLSRWAGAARLDD